MKSESLVIKIGGSPLDTPEFIALKTEFNKLSHPARPEISWTLIESLCLSLFKIMVSTYKAVLTIPLQDYNSMV